jgi:formylglycine-generating enzyme required for sulfatase activity
MFRLVESIILSALLIACVSGCGDADHARPTTDDTSPDGGQRGLGNEGPRNGTGQGERYAFLVGVREYDPAELTSLRFTENDVTDLARTLKTVGYKEDNILLMTQTVGATKIRMLPTSINIRKQLSLLIRELQPDDTLLLAFSGHGLQFKDKDDAFYCPADASVMDRETLISMNNVYEQLDTACRARTKILLLDACRNDPLANLGRSANAEIDLLGGPQKIELPGSLTAFFSCSTGEVSYEHPDLKHGVFLNFVIEALGGKGDFDHDGSVSLAELEQFSVKQTQRFVRVKLSRAQTPERRGAARGLVTLARLPAPASVPVSPPTVNTSTASTPVPSPLVSQTNTFHPTAETPTPTVTQRVNPNTVEVISNSVGMKLKLIPAGEYVMGSVIAEPGRVTDETPHKVQITQAFYLQTTEVTQSQWESVTGTRPWSGQNSAVDGPDYPATYLSWTDAVDFCRQLSVLEGVTYRLPTEAEWEYACRAGTQTTYSFGNNAAALSEYAWWGGNPDDDADTAHRVGLKRPNRLGLYDMHGNVWEWCSDWYGEYEYGAATAIDPQGASVGRFRVYRGGKWQNSASSCRAADREKNPSAFRWNLLGLRVLRTSD